MSAVASIMTKNPKSVGPTTSVVSAAKTMKVGACRLVVREEGQAVGRHRDRYGYRPAGACPRASRSAG